MKWKEYKNAVEYWEDVYRCQREEIPQNDNEKEFLSLLGDGESIIGCILKLEEKYGVSVQDGTEIFEDLRERCNVWEVKNLFR